MRERPKAKERRKPAPRGKARQTVAGPSGPGESLPIGDTRRWKALRFDDVGDLDGESADSNLGLRSTVAVPTRSRLGRHGASEADRQPRARSITPRRGRPARSVGPCDRHPLAGRTHSGRSGQSWGAASTATPTRGRVAVRTGESPRGRRFDVATVRAFGLEAARSRGPSRVRCPGTERFVGARDWGRLQGSKNSIFPIEGEVVERRSEASVE